MQLCYNRPEGFGPDSSYSNIPTQCFVDTILMPLPTWILFVLVLVGLFLPASCAKPFPQYAVRFKAHRYIQLAAYYLIIMAVLAVHSLEIAKLSSSLSYGLGLLPFAYVGILLVVVLQCTLGFGGRVKLWRVFCFLFWLLSFAMVIVKRKGLDDLKEGGMERKRGYEIWEQRMHLSILVGLYASLFGLEIGLMFQKPLRETEWSQTSRGCGKSKNEEAKTSTEV